MSCRAEIAIDLPCLDLREFALFFCQLPTVFPRKVRTAFQVPNRLDEQARLELARRDVGRAGAGRPFLPFGIERATPFSLFYRWSFY